MDENQREQLRSERKNKAKPEEKRKKKDAFFSVTLVQTVLCLFMTVIIAVLSDSGGDSGEKLKNDFSALMNYSLFEEDALQTVKNFFSGSFELMPVLGPVSSAQIESETQSEESAEETEALTEPEPQTEEAQAEETSKDMGGVDIELYKAADGTSFSPVVTTDTIVRPVDSRRYTSYFGYRINPITNVKSFHTGLDIAAPAGTKIKAAYNGKVRKTGEDDRSGKYVILSHDDGFETFYCHCSSVLAEDGAVIRQGETIALVGSTGWSTGPHLHFEVRKNGERLNPLGVLEDDD